MQKGGEKVAEKKKEKGEKNFISTRKSIDRHRQYIYFYSLGTSNYICIYTHTRCYNKKRTST